jgi:hypothetical protein
MNFSRSPLQFIIALTAVFFVSLRYRVSLIPSQILRMLKRPLFIR